MIATDYIFGRNKAPTEPTGPEEYNTYIGGVSSTIPDKATLATKLGILESDIPFFKVLGDNIKAKITANYNLPEDFEPAVITSFRDEEGMVVNAGKWSTAAPKIRFVYFKNATAINPFYTASFGRFLRQVEFPNLLDSPADGFAAGSSNSSSLTSFHLNMGKVEVMGAGQFEWLGENSFGKAIFDSFLETSNAGGENDQVVRWRDTFGNPMVYSRSYTAPGAVTDLTPGTSYATAVHLNFTAPTSVDPISHYEIYIDDFFHHRIKGPGDCLTEITPGQTYTVSIKAVDIYGNRSGNSNYIQATTLTIANSPYPTNGLVTFHGMYNFADLKDSYGSFPGSYPTGCKIGEGLRLKTPSIQTQGSHFTINNFSGITTKASVSFWVKLNKHTPTDQRETGLIFINSLDNATHYPFTDGNIYMSVLTSQRKSLGNVGIADRTVPHMLTITADQDTNEWKFYQNETLLYTGTVGTLTMNSVLEIGRSVYPSTGQAYGFNGEIGRLGIFNNILSLAQIQALYNNGNGITL